MSSESSDEGSEDETYDETIDFPQTGEDIIHYEEREDLFMDEIEEIPNFDYEDDLINNEEFTEMTETEFANFQQHIQPDIPFQETIFINSKNSKIILV